MAGSQLTPEGLSLVRYDEAYEKTAARIQEIVGKDAKIDPQSRFGQLIHFAAELEANLNELVEAAAEVNNPARASGQWLSEMVTINFIERLKAAKSTTVLTCAAGESGATIPAGHLVTTETGGSSWSLDEELYIPPNSTAQVAATCTVAGAISAPADSITVIQNAVFGWESVTNEADALLGRDEETDPELRVRRILAAEKSSSSSVPGIITELLQVENVTNVRVVANTSSAPLPDGQPAHSTRAIVQGGKDQDIGEALYSNVASGLSTFGLISTTVFDPRSNQQFTMYHDRPTYKNVIVEVDSTYSVSDGFPQDGESQVRQNILDWFNDLDIGDDVNRTRLYTPINEVEGHIVSRLQIGLKGGAVSDADIPIEVFEKAIIEVSADDIVLNFIEAT